MSLMRYATLLLLCCTPLLATPASARPVKYHHRHFTRAIEPAPANAFAPYAERHGLDGAQPYAAGLGFAVGAPLAAAPRQSKRQRRIAAMAANSYASATPVGPAAAGAPSFAGGSSLVAEARRYLGGNPTGRSSLWCGNFMNLVLERTGHAASSSNQARSFASYGRRLPGPQVGAIAVMSRGRGGGHVGVVSGIDPSGNPIIISGNHGRKVGESVYPRGRIYAYVMP